MSELEDLDEDLVVIIFLIYCYLKMKQRQKRPMRVWFDDMRKNPQVFKENFLTLSQFDFLFDRLNSSLTAKVETLPKDGISAREKLCITLEYLASGSLQRHLASVYRVSKQHIGQIIENTCAGIFNSLQEDYMPAFSTKMWSEVANGFNVKWNFPNCVGAIDGKHVAIKCPENAGSIFYNYKGYHRIVLLAACDAAYCYTYVNVGAFGSEGDSSIFQQSDFGKALLKRRLKLPPRMPIYGESLPFVFLADGASPVHDHILKPYKPTNNSKQITEEERIFNYRHKRFDLF